MLKVLTTYSSAPASSAATLSRSALRTVSMMIGASEPRRISRHASMPPIPGMFTSSRIRSGGSLRIHSSASSPVLASVITYPPGKVWSATLVESAARRQPQVCWPRSPRVLRAAVHRKRKRKNRAMPQLTRDAHISLLRRNDSLCDGKPHAGAAHEIPLIFSAIKFVENHGLLKIINSGAAVRNTDGHGIAGQFRRNGDRLSRRRIKIRIIDQLQERYLRAFQVGAHL